jgi:hypothetical protein
MLEVGGKFHSSEMVQKLADALESTQRDSFFKEIDSETLAKNAEKTALKRKGPAFECGRISGLVPRKV